MKVSKLVFACLLALGCMLQFSCRRKTIERALTSPGVVLPIGSFDIPAANSPVKGQVLFAGWAAHQSGIAFIAVYLDGTFMTTATLGADRPDVLKAFPQFNPTMVAGWGASLDTSEWAAGPHTIIAKMVSKAGADRDYSVNVVATK